MLSFLFFFFYIFFVPVSVYRETFKSNTIRRSANACSNHPTHARTQNAYFFCFFCFYHVCFARRLRTYSRRVSFAVNISSSKNGLSPVSVVFVLAFGNICRCPPPGREGGRLSGAATDGRYRSTKRRRRRSSGNGNRNRYRNP